jgi:hypothetical protein
MIPPLTASLRHGTAQNVDWNADERRFEHDGALSLSVLDCQAVAIP